MQTQSGLCSFTCRPTSRLNALALCFWTGLGRLSLLFAAWGLWHLLALRPDTTYLLGPRLAFATAGAATPAAPAGDAAGRNAAAWLRTRRTPIGTITEADSTANPGQTALAALALQLADGTVPDVTREIVEQLISEANTPPGQVARAALYLHATQAPTTTVVMRLQAACNETTCGTTQAEQAQLLLALALWESPAPAQWWTQIAQRQFSSGGWSLHFEGDTESIRTTAWTLLALIHAQTQPEAQARAARFLLSCQTVTGAWASTCAPTSGPETGATALALIALRAYGQVSSATLTRAEEVLRRAQRSSGAFPYYLHFPGVSVDATTLAVLALTSWGTPTTPMPPAMNTSPIQNADGLWVLGGAALLLIGFFFLLRRWRTPRNAWSNSR